MKRLGATLGVLMLVTLAACSKAEVTSSPSSTDTPPTRAASPEAPEHSWTAFQMPSRNVGCIFYGGELRCDILSGLRPEPTGACVLDWTGLGIESTGRPGPVCAGDTAYDSHAEVLSYGASWSRNGISCYSRESGLECTNTSGHGFTLAREGWTVT